MGSTPGIPAAVYVRISRDFQGTGLGVNRQRNDCLALAERLGWHVLDVYQDNDVSATSGKERPAYERLMSDVEAGHIRAVVVWDVDRLTRTPRELEDVIDFADRVGLKLASVGGEIDLGTEQGRLMARMKGSVARYEVDQMKRRIRAKHAEMAQAGRHVGPRPYGWDLVRDRPGPGELRVNPAEAAIIRECVARVLAGEGLWRIRNDLNARGVPTSTGGQWQTQTLRRVLLRWRNCGIRTHHGREIGPGEWDPIIDRETHERVSALLTDTARRTNNRGTAEKYLLSGIARCGGCGGPIVGTAEFVYDVRLPPAKASTEPRTRRRRYPHQYRCPHAGCHAVARNMADVDAVIEGVLVGILERDGVRLLGGGSPAEAEQARERITELEAKLALAADQFADDVITGDQLRRITERVRRELDAARARWRAATPGEDFDRFAGADAGKTWAEANVEERRRVLRALQNLHGLTVTIERVGAGRGKKFDPASVRIEWNATTG